MEIPISSSHSPLVFDALPGLKVRHYQPGEGLKIYTYARLYLLNHDLQLALYSFEEKPDPATRIGFLAGSEAAWLRLEIAPPDAAAQNSLWLCTPDETPLPAPPAEYFAGRDEQGRYWGAILSLPHKTLQQAALTLAPGSGFYGGIYTAGGPGRLPGASFMPAPAPTPLTEGLRPVRFDRFLLVDY